MLFLDLLKRKLTCAQDEREQEPEPEPEPYSADASTQPESHKIEEPEEKHISKHQNMSSPAKESPKEEVTRVSKEKITEIVDGFMNNNSINNPLLPDFIERAIYQNVITLILGVVEEVVNDTSIEVLGHKVEMKLKRAD